MADVITRECAASLAQVRAWTLAQTLASAGRAEPWCVTGTFRIESAAPVDRDRLASAIARTIARHEMLRTEIRRHPGLRVPVQVIGEAGVLDASLHVKANDDGSTDLIVSLPATHADVPSLMVFARDLAAYYAGEDPAGEPFQYADHVAYESDLLDSEAGADGLQRWRARLSAIDGIGGDEARG